MDSMAMFHGTVPNSWKQNTNTKTGQTQTQRHLKEKSPICDMSSWAEWPLFVISEIGGTPSPVTHTSCNLEKTKPLLIDGSLSKTTFICVDLLSCAHHSDTCWATMWWGNKWAAKNTAFEAKKGKKKKCLEKKEVEKVLLSLLPSWYLRTLPFTLISPSMLLVMVASFQLQKTQVASSWL